MRCPGVHTRAAHERSVLEGSGCCVSAFLDVGLDVRRLAGAVPALEVDEFMDEGASRFGNGLLDGKPDGGSVGAP